MRATLFVLTTLAFAFPANAADDQKNEASLIAKEEELAAGLDGESNNPLKNFSARGTLKIFASDDERKSGDILGEFSSAGRTFLVKPMHESTKKILAGFNGKEVTLQGKLRAEGKYFLVEDVSGGGAKPVEKRNNRKL